MLLEIAQFIHYVGLVLGAGGATIAMFISMKAEKGQQLVPAVMKIMPSISKLIWAGIILLALSGIVLAKLVPWPINQTIFSVTIFFVALLVINGAILSFYFMKKMSRLAPKGEAPSQQFLKTKKMTKISSTIGLVLWYVIIGLSVAL